MSPPGGNVRSPIKIADKMNDAPLLIMTYSFQVKAMGSNSPTRTDRKRAVRYWPLVDGKGVPGYPCLDFHDKYTIDDNPQRIQDNGAIPNRELTQEP